MCPISKHVPTLHYEPTQWCPIWDKHSLDPNTFQLAKSLESGLAWTMTEHNHDNNLYWSTSLLCYNIQTYSLALHTYMYVNYNPNLSGTSFMISIGDHSPDTRTWESINDPSYLNLILHFAHRPIWHWSPTLRVCFHVNFFTVKPRKLNYVTKFLRRVDRLRNQKVEPIQVKI